MRELTTKQLKHKFTDGTEEIVDIAVDAENVDEINFEPAKERDNIKPKEGLLIILGKLAKWYIDLKNVAWSGSYTDLADKPELDDIEGTLSIEKGGTGANSAAAARKNLGLGKAATYGVADDDETSDTSMLANAAIVTIHRKEINELKMAFLDGVNKIYNKLDGLGFTPVPNSPDGICNAIQDMYDKRYEKGIEEGGFKSWSTSVSNGATNTTPYIISIPKDCKIFLLTSLHVESGWEPDKEEHTGAGIHLYKFNSKAEAEAVAWTPWTGSYTYRGEYSNRDSGVSWEYNSNFTLEHNWDLSVKSGEAILVYCSAGEKWRPESATYRWLFY